MTNHPPTEQQLDEYEALIARSTPLGAATASPGMATALLAEVRRLRAQVTQLDRALGETIDDRDQAQEIADKLAYAVAPIEVIGEHSSMNCPWTNALDLITPAVEADRLRVERRRYRIAWRMARTRALATGGAADRYATRAREGQTALQDMLGTLIGAQIELDAAQSEIAALRTVLAGRGPVAAAPAAVEAGE